MDKDQLTTNFKWTEITCPCCDTIKIFPKFWEHMEALQRLRDALGFPIVVNSGHRCEKHNKEVGGKEHSWHLLIATDVRPGGYYEGLTAAEKSGMISGRLREIYDRAPEFGFTGRGLYEDFVHLDMRPEKMDWRG